MSDVINAHDLGVAGGYIIEAAMQGDIDQLKAENDKLREYVTKLEAANLDVTARLTDYIGQYDPTDAFVAEVKADNAKLLAENARLKAALDVVFEDAKEIAAQMCNARAENAKLRELCEDMLSCIEIRATFSRPPTTEMYETFYKRARELEVDDD